MPQEHVTFTKWKPQGWKPEYDQMIVYSVLGMPHGDIARKLGRTPSHVSNVLNLPQSIELRTRLQERIRAKAIEDVPKLLGEIAQKTVKRLNELLDDDEIVRRNPLQIIDRGMKVVEGLGHLNKGNGNGGAGVNVAGNAIILPAGTAQQFMEGMQKADEARRLNAGKLNGSNE